MLLHLLTQQAWHVCFSGSAHELFLKTVQFGHVPVLSILIEQGMAPKPLNLNALVKCASENGQAQTLSLLLRNAALLSPFSPLEKRAEGFVCGKRTFCDSFFVACKNGDKEVVKLLIEHSDQKGRVVNVLDHRKDHYAPTALHHACVGGSVDMVRFLVAAGARFTDTETFITKADPLMVSSFISTFKLLARVAFVPFFFFFFFFALNEDGRLERDCCGSFSCLCSGGGTSATPLFVILMLLLLVRSARRADVAATDRLGDRAGRGIQTCFQFVGCRLQLPNVCIDKEGGLHDKKERKGSHTPVHPICYASLC